MVMSIVYMHVEHFITETETGLRPSSILLVWYYSTVKHETLTFGVNQSSILYPRPSSSNFNQGIEVLQSS